MEFSSVPDDALMMIETAHGREEPQKLLAWCTGKLQDANDLLWDQE